VGKKFEERPSSPDPAEQAGYHISFVEYMKACWWPMMITVTICMIYLLIAY
jgi:Na+/H+ antiporter NhaD/arsenite permease-like protein